MKDEPNYKRLQTSIALKTWQNSNLIHTSSGALSYTPWMKWLRRGFSEPLNWISGRLSVKFLVFFWEKARYFTKSRNNPNAVHGSSLLCATLFKVCHSSKLFFSNSEWPIPTRVHFTNTSVSNVRKAETIPPPGEKNDAANDEHHSPSLSSGTWNRPEGSNVVAWLVRIVPAQ